MSQRIFVKDDTWTDRFTEAPLATDRENWIAPADLGIGAQGATGAQGSYGGAISIPFLFSTSTVNSDPGDGFIRLDNATQNLSTTIRIDLLSSDGTDWDSVVTGFADSTNTVKGYIRIVKKIDS